jgi:hypothetical protein
MAKTVKVLLIAMFFVAGVAGAAPGDMSPQARARAQQAVDGGIKYLLARQAANGSVLNSAGLTALSLTANLQNPSGAGNVDKVVIDKYAAFLASMANPDGSIVEQKHDHGHNTAVSSVALSATTGP